MKKILLIVGIGLVVLMIVAVAGVGIFIGPIAKMGMETIGSKITQVPITVDALDVSLLTGSAQVKGLMIGNPVGYKTPDAIKVGSASVKLEPLSVFSDKIVVRSIRIESPEISYEEGLGGNNLSKIMDNVNAVAKTGGLASSSANTNIKSEAGKKPAPKIEVDDFLITGAKARVSLTGLSSKEMTLSLPGIHLTNLGKESNGMTVTELFQTVLSKVTGTTLEAVTNSVTSVGKDIQNLGKDVGKDASEQINTITQGISGLLGK